MGEALLKKRAPGIFNAFSAGTEPKDEVLAPVIEVMREIGLDISANKPKGLNDLGEGTEFEKVITVCSGADKNCPAFFGPTQRLHWPFEDPAGATGSDEEVLDFCRSVRDRIDARICEWLRQQDIEPAE
jgi:arsenate reductase